MRDEIFEALKNAERDANAAYDRYQDTTGDKDNAREYRDSFVLGWLKSVISSAVISEEVRRKYAKLASLFPEEDAK